MPTPVTSDKTPSLANERNSAPQHRDAGLTPQHSEGETSGQMENTIMSGQTDISRAAHLFETETSRTPPSGGVIGDRDQALSVLAQLKEQLAGDPAAALRAIGKADGDTLSALLQAPA